MNVKNKKILLAVVGTLLVYSPMFAVAGEADASITLPAVQVRVDQERLALAQENPQEFLKKSLESYNSKIKDYTCVFVKQEFLKGELSKEQKIQVKFREGPFSVFMQWIENPSMVDRVLYVKGVNDNQAMIKPAGFLGWFVRSHVNRPVDTPDAAKMSRRRLDQFGFGNALKLITEINDKAQKAGDLKFSYTGTSKVDGRPTYVFERFLPEKSCYPDQHMIVHVDQEWLVPLATFCYDARDQLLGKYIYEGVKLNVGLAVKEFTAEANGL
jgi:NAD-specific glutamate dehydrogenase